MNESLTRLSFSEFPACPELGRGRPFEARPGPTATRPFCKVIRPPMRRVLTVLSESFAQGTPQKDVSRACGCLRRDKLPAPETLLDSENSPLQINMLPFQTK